MNIESMMMLPKGGNERRHNWNDLGLRTAVSFALIPPRVMTKAATEPVEFCLVDKEIQGMLY
jgi:hypothetical protein